MKFSDRLKDLFLENIPRTELSKHEESKKDSSSFKDIISSQFIYYLALIPVLALAWFVRTRNLVYLKGKYLLGLDPYCYYRYASYILEHGKLMTIDMMRYVPVGYVTQPSDIFFSTTLAWWYKLIAWTGFTYMEFHIIYPVLAGIIGFIFFFLFVREMFGNKVAIVSTAFAAVIPAYIYRTGAGFADHEAMGMMFMFASLWLFAVAWQNKNNKWLEKISNKLKLPNWISLRGIIFGAGSGLLAGCMVPIWGGYTFLTASIGIFVIASLLFSKLEKRHLCIFVAWLAFLIPFLAYKGNWLSWIKSIDALLLVFVLAVLLIYFLLPRLKMFSSLERYAPRPFIALIISAVIGMIVVVGFKLIDFVALFERITHPAGISRLAFTVSENAQPYFIGGNGWWSSFGWTTILMFIGAIFVFYMIFRREAKYAISLTTAWIIAFAAFIFGRYSPDPKHAAITQFFSNSYIYFFATFLIVLFGVYIYTYTKDREAYEKLFNAEWQLILLFVWFAFSAVIARGAIRTIFAFAPVVALVAGLFVVRFGEWMWRRDNLKWGAVLLAIFAIFCIASNANASYLISKGSGSGYPGNWESSMEWIKENTADNAVIEHWWDYGYWTQTMGERASVVDGGNAMGWDHQTGRYGLLGRDPNNYLSYLKTHNVTHLLISSEEIGKFHAFATIGSDENWDLRSTIGIFSLQQQKEVRNGTQLIYGGQWGSDKDYIIGNIVLAEGSSAVIGFSFTQVEASLTDAHVFLYHNGKQSVAPLACVCQDGKCAEKTVENAFPGCLVLLPKFISQTEYNPIGAGFFVSEKIKDTTLVRLYIIGEEIEYFKEMYNDNTPLGLFGNNIVGPIKIWEIQYPEGIKTDEKYLESSPYG